jgi:hypothetical protein
MSYSYLNSKLKDHDEHLVDETTSLANKEVPDPGRTLLSWAVAAFKYKEERLLETRGLDALMHVRTLRLMIVILFSFCILGLGNHTSMFHLPC